MKIIEIIPCREWFNPCTRATASIYGAVPYHGEQGAWTIRTTGYTWRMDNGTIGIGRKPALTLVEAAKIAENFNNRVPLDKVT